MKVNDDEDVMLDPDDEWLALVRAAREAGHPDRRLVERISHRAVDDLALRFRRRVPDVEDAQDAVERALEEGLADVSRAYVLYRQRRAELREAKHANVVALFRSKRTLTAQIPVHAVEGPPVMRPDGT